MNKLIFLISSAVAAACAAAYPHLRVHPGSIEWAAATAVAHVNTWVLALLGQVLPRAWMWRIPDWATAGVLVGVMSFILIFVALRAAGAMLRRLVPGKHKRGAGGKAATAPQKMLRGIRVNSKITLPLAIEVKHILCSGGTGSGKSQTLRSAAIAARRRGDPAIIPAVEAALFEALYNPDQDEIINPFDARGVAWSPLAEMQSEIDAALVARLLVPEAGDPREETWRAFGRQLLAGLLAYVWRIGGTNADLRRLVVAGDPDDLREVLAGSDAEALTREGSKTMMDNALSTAGSIASPIGKFAPNAGREGWSVTRWVEQAVAAQDAGEPHGWLWITAPERQRAAMLPILSSISALAISNVLGSPEREARRIYLIADEIGSLPAIAEFEGALTRGRKYGLRVIGAVQSIEQLRDPKRYGRAGAASLLSCFSTKFLFRAADPESSAWCSKLVGQRHVTRMLENSSRGESSQRSQQGGGSSSSSTSSKNEHHSIEAAILDSEFTSLADLRCYLMLPGHAGAFGPVAVDYVPLRGEQPFFVPRPPPSAGTTPPVPVQPTPPSGAADGGEAPGADDLLSALDSLGGDAETETEPQ